MLYLVAGATVRAALIGNDTPSDQPPLWYNYYDCNKVKSKLKTKATPCLRSWWTLIWNVLHLWKFCIRCIFSLPLHLLLINNIWKYLFDTGGPFSWSPWWHRTFCSQATQCLTNPKILLGALLRNISWSILMCVWKMWVTIIQDPGGLFTHS